MIHATEWMGLEVKNFATGIATEEFARRFRIKPQSAVARLCRTGSYFGICPIKLPSGRLVWPDVWPEGTFCAREK